MPRISVIVPAYNVADYVDAAMESLRAQTFTDWECILVDDGSTDGTALRCDALAAKDPRFAVIHQANAGAPAARNCGIERAVGDYLYFMDADDHAEPTMLEAMLALADAHQLELVVAGFYIDTYHGDSMTTQTLSVPSAIYTEAQAFRKQAHHLFDRNLLYTPWNKLFSAEYIRRHHIRFRNTFWDDFPFVLDVIYDVERVGVMEACFYHFVRARAESETTRYRAGMIEKREEEHSWMLDLYAHWQVDDPAAREMVARRYVERLLGCVENLCNPECALAYPARHETLHRLLTSAHARDAFREARPRALFTRVALLPLKLRLTTLALWEGYLIGFVKRHCGKLFTLLKNHR